MVKKVLLFLLFFTCLPVFAEYEGIFYGNNTPFDIYIKEKKYTYFVNNCYDLKSFKYDKKTDSYYIDMIIDLMFWNEHQLYESPYKDGYISHLLFKTKLKGKKLTVECNGFVVADVVPEYRNGRSYSTHYDIIAVHKGKPNTVKNIKEFENTFSKWINTDSHIKIIKNLADNLKD